MSRIRPARAFRQWLVSRATDLGRSAAPRIPEGVIDAVESAVASAGPHLPILGRMVADNMRTAGLYSPAVHREYFAWAASHLAGLMHAFRLAGGGAKPHGGGMCPELAGFVQERVLLDDSIARLREAYAQGKGVVLLGVHAANFMLVLGRMNQELPITVYQRYSKDPRREDARRRYAEMCGLNFIAEPPSATNPARRAELMAGALREGRILIITPDMVQNRETGVPVRFFDREVYLPGGAAALSLLVEAPLVTVVARPAGGRAVRLAFYGPMSAQVTQRRKGWRQEATRERMQWFADLMVNEFLRPCPALWFLWGDKRWTRVFRGDPRYTRPLDP